jgi:segregation and condensation protein B
VKAEQIVEAVLFASDAPLRADEIARADESLDEDAVEMALQALKKFYLESGRAFGLVELAEGYQLLTEPQYASYLDRLETVPRPSRLSGPALEALAIIAYRQPIGRIEVEYIRGVGSSGVIRTLQDRGLVEVVGRGEGLGRPLLYGTTRRFLEHFAFRSLEDLPRAEDLPVVLRDRSTPILPEDDSDEGEEGVDSGDANVADSGEEGADSKRDGGGDSGDEGADSGAKGADSYAEVQPVPDDGATSQ